MKKVKFVNDSNMRRKTEEIFLHANQTSIRNISTRMFDDFMLSSLNSIVIHNVKLRFKNDENKLK